MKKIFGIFIVSAIILTTLIFGLSKFVFKHSDTEKTQASTASATITSYSDWNGYSTKTNIDLETSSGSAQLENKGFVPITGGAFSHNSCASSPSLQPENIADENPPYPTTPPDPPPSMDDVCDPTNWIEWDFTGTKSISRVHILSAEVDTDPSIYAKYSFQYWNGSSWVEFLTGINQGGGVWESHNISPEITTDKIRLYHGGETGPGDNEVLSIFEIQLLSPITGTIASGATQIDGGANFWEWQTFTPTQTVPANTAVSYRFRSSADGTDWDAWSASQTPTSGNALDISGLVTSDSGGTKYRYLQVETTLSNTDGASTPTVASYSIGYHTEVKPNKPTAATAVVQ